ncbi:MULTISPECIES: bifunctional methylenetetrahydrofolate dehydrogenase/methenyltetrahydrofolate cyclohydrolase FolD [unclassified Psychrobacillus]|uniref:bifunctional methylenetetrahydrofolate dehydrogenase/methenyltetrahydrofolate cyclohydrolase FolD n=1 Tax=unclassified Psychrobacillus TaxID=2636677 RepID=UPI0012445D66|nr:bifunctional methylenetetrahydrofolate dehydrogenase/methenyltetrahydrofolate cyclohydrolase FolD [Psychrobacillus sp. AK 1817]QEY19422.1 bifunctional methylenetetrahydrofolate dehydrogenase/methenyltetrahydrofolate cyclohydrolase FolD [Psychrobacillus sp. AK 1817]
MADNLINGKEIAGKVTEKVKERVDNLKAKGITPGLAVVLVGSDPASQTYVNSKTRTCERLGMYSVMIELEETISEEELLNSVEKLNQDEKIHGILVQLPLPKQINEDRVIAAISPLKDVDGFHPVSVGKMMIGQPTFLSCTPFGVMKLLEYSDIEIEGKHAVVIGRSNIVGKPMGQLLLQKNATVTYCHSKTKNLHNITKQADILIVATGQPKMIDSSYLKEGVVVIDVGIHRNEDNKLCGDVDFASAKEVASKITPVPGGVGPMTIAMLMENTCLAAENTLDK